MDFLYICVEWKLYFMYFCIQCSQTLIWTVVGKQIIDHTVMHDGDYSTEFQILILKQNVQLGVLLRTGC